MHVVLGTIMFFRRAQIFALQQMRFLAEAYKKKEYPNMEIIVSSFQSVERSLKQASSIHKF